MSVILNESDLKIAKFMVKHTDRVTRIFKYIPRDKIYVLYRTIPNQEYKKKVLNTIMSLKSNTEFIGVYSRLDGIRKIYEILGVRK